MAELFGTGYRSKHEPQSDRFIPQILAHTGNQITESDFRRFIRSRDSELWLEFEANHLLYYCIKILVNEFQDAKFILTIREPYSWLDSVANQQYLTARDNTLEYWTRMAGLMYLPSGTKESSQDRLPKYGLPTVDVFLEYWAKHNQEILSAVPSSRLLIVKTSAITSSSSQIGAFVGVAPDTLNVSKAHSFMREKKPLKVSDLVDKDYLQDRIEFYCGDLSREFFGPG